MTPPARQGNQPNLFILGAAKAGTTTLYDLLCRHPDVFLTEVKEPQFFSNDGLYARGIDDYLSRHFGGSEHYAVAGEATPHYLYCEKVAARIAEHFPGSQCRFIVVLRDPVQRAWSLYWNLVSEGVEPLEFDAALVSEAQRIDDATLLADGSLRYAYVSSGLYARQLKAYFQYFDPGQFHIMWFEDLVADTPGCLRDVCRFLGIDVVEDLDVGKKSNASHRPRLAWLHRFARRPNVLKSLVKPLLPERLRYKLANGLIEMNRKSVKNPALAPDVAQALRARFADDITELEQLTGRDLSAWRVTPEKVAT